MLSYLVRRLLIAIPTLIATSFAMFAILYEAGDPIAALRGSTRLDPNQIAMIIEQEGYNDPFFSKYWSWLTGFLTGDWGTSTQNGEPAFDEIMSKLPATLELLGIALVVTVLIAIPIGIFSATNQYSAFDNAATGFSYLGFAFPTFFVGLVLQIIAVEMKDQGWGLLIAAVGFVPLLAGLSRVRHGAGRTALAAGAVLIIVGVVFRHWNQGEFLFFTAQRTSPQSDGSLLSIDHLQHLVLPVLTLAVVSIASWSRFLRASMLEVLNQDYLRTARAKGLSERRVVYRHGLRNGLLPLITIMALDAAALFAGAVVTESVFAWPGIGTRLLDAVKGTDIPVSMGIVMLGAVMVVLFNLIADIAYTFADPRISYS